jgi:hypothetical protein
MLEVLRHRNKIPGTNVYTSLCYIIMPTSIHHNTLAFQLLPFKLKTKSRTKTSRNIHVTVHPLPYNNTLVQCLPTCGTRTPGVRSRLRRGTLGDIKNLTWVLLIET